MSTVQELRLDAGGSYVVDDEPSTGHEARDYLLVDLSVELRGLNIGETKRDLLEASRIVEGIAVKDLDRISRPGAGNVLAGKKSRVAVAAGPVPGTLALPRRALL